MSKAQPKIYVAGHAGMVGSAIVRQLTRRRHKAEILLTENQSTYIPLGVKHRLENPGKTELELIEVQSGGYLGEDDIVRFEDTYGRAAVKLGQA